MKRAFTLVEVVVTLVVIAILMIAGINILAPSNSIKLGLAAKKLTADLDFARSSALSLGQWHSVSFEVDPLNIYSVHQTSAAGDIIIENPAQPGRNFIINLNNDFAGVKIQGVSIGGQKIVKFSPLGTPYTSEAGTALTVTGTITLEYSGQTKTITVAPNTGRISSQ